MDEPILGRLLLVLCVVGALLFATRVWLKPAGPGGEGGPRGDGPSSPGAPNLERGRGPELLAYAPRDGPRGDGPRGEGPSSPGAPNLERGRGPDLLAYAPREGRWLQEIVVDGGGHVLVPIDIRRLDEETFELALPWRPPEPDLWGPPPPLGEHAANIRLRVQVSTSGHVADVVGPDDYFDPLDAVDPTLADTLRGMELEEQIDQVMRWQLTGFMSHPVVAGAVHEALGQHPGLGDQPGLEAMFEYTFGNLEECPNPAADEKCVPVTIRSSTDPRPELSAKLWIGRDTGMEWRGELQRTREGETRRVVRQLIRPKDAPEGVSP